VIFHDATLAAIAALEPQSLEDLQGVSGIGAKKLEAYGEGAGAELHEPHAARLAHLGLDAMLCLQLIQKFSRAELSRQYVHLPFDGGKVAGAQLLHPGQPRAQLAGHQ
jgi:hypothetical protein